MMVSWEDFKKVEVSRSARKKYLYRDGKFFHVLLSQQFDRFMLEQLYQTATAIRKIHKHAPEYLRTLLPGKRVLNLFAQPSTRTVESFVAAADKLGLTARVVQDLNISSFKKGESVEDSIRTLSSYFEAIVVRHEDDQFALRAAWATSNSKRPIPVISGGSGCNQHVTQSLLDIYTLRYSFKDVGGVDQKKVAIISDLLRNRAARSLIYLLTKYTGVKLILISPESMKIDDNLRKYIEEIHNIPITNYVSVEEALIAEGESIDAIYVTRNQKEYKVEEHSWNEEDFYLKWEYRDLIRKDCVIMHPLPRVNELPEAWDDFPGCVVWRQVRNGMWIRSAIFAHLFGIDDQLRKMATE